MKRPYIGITGFVDREEVETMLDMMGEQMIGEQSNRLLMVGVLANWKTMYGDQESNRYPKIGNISDIFMRHPLALNLVHYHTKKTDRLCEQLSALTILGGRNLHGFQLNFTWPPRYELYEYRSLCLNRTIVMVIGDEAFEEVGYSPQQLTSRIAEYRGLVDYVLLDQSEGNGIDLDTEFMRTCLDSLYRQKLDMGFGIAGGLSSTTMHLVAPLIKDFPDLSFDAEAKLRNDDDTLNLELAKNYLNKSLEVLDNQK